VLILGGTCALLVEAAELIVWFNDRRRALPHQDPFAALADATVFAAVRRPAKGLSRGRPVYPQAAGRCAARPRTPTAAVLECRVPSVNQGRKHDDAGKHH